MGLSGSGLLVHRYWSETVLLLSFRPMRTSPRFAYSVPKIGKGPFSPLRSVPRLLSQAGSLQHPIRRPAFTLPRSSAAGCSYVQASVVYIKT